jgi:hypothetical protein
METMMMMKKIWNVKKRRSMWNSVRVGHTASNTYDGYLKRVSNTWRENTVIFQTEGV